MFYRLVKTRSKHQHMRHVGNLSAAVICQVRRTDVVDQQKTPEPKKIPSVRGLFGRGFFSFFDSGFDLPER